MSEDKETVVSEKRVTKKVIRRRPGEEAPPPPVVAAPEPEVKVVIEEPKEAGPKRKGVKREEIRTSLKKVDMPPIKDPVVQKAPVPVVTAAPAPVEEEQRYKRIKVIETPASQKFSPASPAQTQNPLGARKEIIEIRDFNSLKSSRGMKMKRKMPMGKKVNKTEITTPKAIKRVLKISDGVSVGDLAKRMSVKVGELISKLLSMGMVVTINQVIDIDTTTLVAAEFGFEVEKVLFDADDLLQEQEKAIETKPEQLKNRPPVVTVMGHVDHGKTSLLDRIRKANVAAGEAGGITQHIGAYTVKNESGKLTTFIDTPGHQAFTSMRARGAKVTDIVILVVAADDGVMPQTKEAISHAQNAKVPIIVAVNKIDKPGSNIEKIKKELTEFQMVPEEWGGETMYVPVSAKTGEGVNQLLETVHLQAEVLDLKANPDRLAKGVVLEASLDKQRGVVTTVLVQDGTLKDGDVVLASTFYGRVRTLKDDQGNRVREAGPSHAVELMGLSGVASAGDTISVVADERTAKQIALLKHNQVRQKELAKNSKVSLDDLYQKIEEGDVKELKVVVKADMAGSIEVLTKTLEELSTPKVTLKVIYGGVGGVSENDVMLASASKAFIVSFHVRPDSSVRKLAEQQGVEIRSYEIIYELTEDITKAMTGLLQPKLSEKILGHALVQEVYNIPKIGAVAGCLMKDGKAVRSSKLRLLRDNVPVYVGALKSLKRFKDDAKEVQEGMECGLSIENFNDIKAGDMLEFFEIEETAATL